MKLNTQVGATGHWTQPGWMHVAGEEPTAEAAAACHDLGLRP